ncbi:MAG TPA: helix-turn-helix domain-containing protein [Pseudonocardiaceae bacterium]
MTSPNPREPAGPGVPMVLGDGAVIVPAGLAAEVLARLSRDILTDARTTGRQPTTTARLLLDALHSGAQRHRFGPQIVAEPPEPATLDDHTSDMVSVAEMAHRMGCTPRHVRALLAAGRLAGRKSGGTWIVHIGQTLPNPEVPHGNPRH